MDKPFVVLGEASESEDEGHVSDPNVAIKSSNSLSKSVGLNKGTVVAGEASESDDESEDTFREAFFARSGATQDPIEEDHHDPMCYDTLLHRKLRECNVSLYNNVSNQSQMSLVRCIKAVNNINQQLLVTQIQVQDAATSISKVYESITKLSESLNTLLATPYIPDINIV